jgi:hypothetical protein
MKAGRKRSPSSIFLRTPLKVCAAFGSGAGGDIKRASVKSLPGCGSSAQLDASSLKVYYIFSMLRAFGIFSSASLKVLPGSAV